MTTNSDKKPSGFLSSTFGAPPNDVGETDDWEDVQQWVDLILDPLKAHERWDSEPEKPLPLILAEREAKIQSEREAELNHIRKLREGRDSLLRQLTMATNAEQLGWVTTRFHTLISKGEDVLDRMVHLRSAMLDGLARAQEMFHNALRVAADRITTQQQTARTLAEHEERLRKIRQDSLDYCRQLREDTNRKVRESQDRNFRKYHMYYCECGNSKPTGHLFCVECYYGYRRTRWR